MKPQRIEHETIAHLSSESIRKFAESIAGEIILPDDERYQKARRVWDHAVDRRPAIIARCAGVDGVRRAIQLARHRAVLAGVASGGRSLPGHDRCDARLAV